jgi:hypothetical protein
VEQEARSSAKIYAIAAARKEADAQADQRWARADERWGRTEESIRGLLSIAEIHEREIATLSASGRATDDRLNALINIVERQISDRRNGKK